MISHENNIHPDNAGYDDVQIYERFNRQAHTTIEGTFEEVADLDKRLWTDPIEIRTETYIFDCNDPSIRFLAETYQAPTDPVFVLVRNYRLCPFPRFIEIDINTHQFKEPVLLWGSAITWMLESFNSTR